jgi:hypothetical protein
LIAAGKQLASYEAVDAASPDLAFMPLVTVRSGSCAEIQNAIDSLPPSGGQVVLSNATYVCSTALVIDRNNVALRGQGPGTVLRLADGADAPVLVLGQTVEQPDQTRQNLHVSDLMIDGNRTNQTYECWGGECDEGGLTVIRNNGITLRRVSDIVVERVTVASARSGGLVTEKGCQRLTIQDFSAYDNHFDGLAGYQTEDSLFTRLNLHENEAAGLSFDIDFDHNVIGDTIVTGNGKVGIFMRDSRYNIFHDLQIRDSGEHGVFLAEANGDPTQAATNNTFHGLVASGSKGTGFRVNDLSCTKNVISASQLIDNAEGGISEPVDGLVLRDPETVIEQ